MSVQAREALDRQAVPWLFASALATVMPHITHQPTWLTAGMAIIFASAAYLWWRNLRLPGHWPLALCVIIVCAGIYWEFRTLFGRDAGVSMLVLFMGMKLFELRSRRDAYVLVMLGYFLPLTHYFYSQSIPTGLWLLASLILLTATLIRFHAGRSSSVRSNLQLGTLMVAQSIPFMVVLFLLFPRISGPLWGLPQDAHAGKTGLTDQMSPGNISLLAQSGEIAFRAQFQGPVPDRQQLYWRGPVLDSYDGITWYPATTHRIFTPRIEALSSPLVYTLTIEPHNQPWLLALDAPVSWPDEAFPSTRLTLLHKENLRERQRIGLSSALQYRFNKDENSTQRQLNLALPPGYHPRTIALAQEWKAKESDPEKLVQKALSFFREQPFFYTLQPPILGDDSADEFLFISRRGFCEHYASAFVILMRAADIPARVVTGYQGGELNPLDGYLIVRQSDAHAWAEVWINGQGWIRVDPTAAVSPARVERGIGSAIRAGEPLPGAAKTDQAFLLAVRQRWEALNNAWNQSILGYNAKRQRQVLSQWGIVPDWRNLAGLLAAAGGLVLFALIVWALHQRHRIDPARQLWNKALRRLRKRGIDCGDWEAPLALARRLWTEHPKLAEAVSDVAHLYCATRYGNRPQLLQALQAAVRRLP